MCSQQLSPQESVTIAANPVCLNGAAIGADLKSNTQAKGTAQLGVEVFPGHQYHYFAEMVHFALRYLEDRSGILLGTSAPSNGKLLLFQLFPSDVHICT